MKTPTISKNLWHFLIYIKPSYSYKTFYSLFTIDMVIKIMLQSGY